MSTNAFAAEVEREKTVMTAAPSATELSREGARSVNFRVAERPKPDAPAPATARTAAPIEAAPATSSEDEALTASSLGELAAFVGRAAEYESTLPEDVAAYYLREGGGAGDATLVKVVALAADHFLANVVADAAKMQELRTGGAGPPAPPPPPGDDAPPPPARCLRTKDVMLALQRRGVTTLHGEGGDGDVAPADAPKEPAEKAPPPRGKAKKRARGE
jgi:hypothetical protein